MRIDKMVATPLATAAPFAFLCVLTTQYASGAVIGSLQDLINTGTTGVVVGGLRFSSFSYSGVGDTAPTASQIQVGDASAIQPDSPSGSPQVAISFIYGWNAINGQVAESLIRYRVSVVDPAQSIICIDLHFNGIAAVPGTATYATVTEMGLRPDGQYVVDSNQAAIFAVSNDGLGGLPDTNVVHQPIIPSRDMIISKDIMVVAGPTNAGGGMATISYVDNSYVVVPEPAALSVLVLCGLSLRRRQSKGM